MMLGMLTGHLFSVSNLTMEFTLTACAVLQPKVKVGCEACGKRMHRGTLRNRVSAHTIKDNGYIRNIYKQKLLMLN